MRKLSFLLLLLCIGLLFGQLQWQDGGVPVNVNYPLYWYNSGAKVINGVSYFVWTESISGDPDLYMQGYDANGDQIWEEHLLICDAPKYQGRAEVIAADGDNVIVAWQDTRNIPGLYFGEGYEIYLQKISAAGEYLWEEAVVLPEECYRYEFNLLPDNFGGCYISYNTNAWHINTDGELYPGWESGISVSENYYSYNQVVDSDGNLVVAFNEGDSCYVSKISAFGDFEWDHLQISDFYLNTDNLFSDNNTVTILSRTDHSLYMQYISEEGEVWTEPVELYSSENYFSELLADRNSNGYYMLCCEYETGWRAFKISSMGEVFWNNALTIYNGFEGLQTLSNDNYRVWGRGEQDFTLWEYNNEGTLISPEDGWCQLDFPQYSYSVYISAFGGEDATTIGFKNCPSDSDEEILTFQIINENGILVCGDEFAEISRGRNDFQLVDGLFKVNEYEVVLLRKTYSNTRELNMKVFDEDGNQVGETMTISSDNIEYAHPIKVIDDRLYFANEVEVDYESYLYINAVEFDDDPHLVWGEEGLYLGAGGFINNEINITRFDEYENDLLITWTQESPYGNTQMQRLVDDEFVWQYGGITYPCQHGELHRVYAYEDYIMQVISWGNGYYLNRVSEDGEALWDEEILIAGNLCTGKPVGIKLENGNMLFLRGEYTNNGLALVEHRITPEGENLSGDQGDVINFLNGEMNLNIIPHENSYGVVTQTGQGFVYENIRFRRYDLAGEEIGDLIELEHEEYTDINTIDFINNNLAITYSGGYGSSNLEVVDFDGWVSEYLPQNPYEYNDLSNYPVPTYTCSTYNELYFCWVNCYSSERPDEGEYGWSWYMQKFTIPVVENSEDEIAKTEVLRLYPNPFNPELKISWEKDSMQSEDTEIEIYNLKGQKIRYMKTPSVIGNIVWDGRNEEGRKCSSGIYYVRYRSGGKNVIHKAVLLK